MSDDKHEEKSERALEHAEQLFEAAKGKEYQAEDHAAAADDIQERIYDDMDKEKMLLESIFQEEIRAKKENRDWHDARWMEQDSWEQSGARDEDRDLS
jgi:hypothetical protein